MDAKQIVAFDHVRIAFFDECGQSLERVSLGFFDVVRIDNDQFFPAGVVRERDAHDVIVVAGVTDPGYSEHFELHPFQFFERQILEQGASSCGEIMLHRIGECEEIAAGVFQSVAKRDQFLPAIDGDQPAVLQIAPEFFRFDAKIDNVRVGPDERMKRLDVGNGRSICFAPMHT